MERDLDVVKTEAEIGKLMAETSKLNEEARKLTQEARKFSREVFWYPIAISTGLIGTVAAATLALSKLLP